MAKGLASPSGKRVQFENNKICIKCCHHAFSKNKKCKYALCVPCTNKKLVQATSKGGQLTRSRRGNSASADRGEISNDEKCRGDHRLNMLTEMKESNYLARNRNGSDLDWVAVTCWECGDEF